MTWRGLSKAIKLCSKASYLQQRRCHGSADNNFSERIFQLCGARRYLRRGWRLQQPLRSCECVRARMLYCGAYLLRANGPVGEGAAGGAGAGAKIRHFIAC